ncbi:DUF1002 domain-containing protein [Shouchella shacheensis]|uniref:DUF1002 domain-containing protein n=1 Tax=Shouchella shacheensis TaxID=1649580 RepID=UPI00073FF3DB|nr:DUF1002 domain-containing protein [Shouchella shacheensis]
MVESKSWKKWMAAWLVAMLMFPAVVVPETAKAEAVPGEVVVTLGDDLSPREREEILERMDVVESEAEILTVTNDEEYLYLGEYISPEQIGNQALSSSKITIAESGTGIDVTSDNINWVSDAMYANALITAGVEDADVYVTAPFSVSGTGALTGVIKAYEEAVDFDIPEEQKDVAAEEMVKTGNLGDSIGEKEATELMTRIKEEVAQTNIDSEDEMRELIQRLAEELGITLSEEELNGLVSLFMRMKEIDIDWERVQNQISNVRDNLGEYLESEEAQGFIQSFLDSLRRLFDSIRDFFRS